MANRLWAITCLFNPAGYRSRTENYRTFRKHLSLPLITVELAFDEPFNLVEDDADILLQVRGGDRMWQKERLLNLALLALPAECDQVLWIDADIIIRADGWYEAISVALDEFVAVQPFATVANLGPDGETVLHGRSTISALTNTLDSLNLSPTVDRAGGSPCAGHVWACRRELLDRHGLYDGCIVGGGDTAFLCAVTARFDKVIRMHCMGEAQRRRYLDWALPLSEEAQGRVTYLDYEIEHLWHGSISDRRGILRHQDLAAIGFDPFRDISLTEQGLWQWASDRPELHRFVTDYFKSRNEDAQPLSPVTS